MQKRSQLHWIRTIPTLGDVYSINEKFECVVESAPKDGILSVRDLAYARIWGQDLAAEFAGISSKTKECMINIPHNKTIVSFDSPIAKNSIRASKAHSEGMPYSVDETLYKEMAEEDLHKNPLEKRAFYLPSDVDFKINVNDLKSIIPREILQKYEYGRLEAKKLKRENLDQLRVESLPFLMDVTHMKRQSEITQFAVNLFRDMSIAYAIFNQADIPVSVYSRESIDNEPFAFATQMGFLGKSEFSRIRTNGIQGKREHSYIAFKSKPNCDKQPVYC